MKVNLDELTVVPFGKYKGKKLNDVPEEYLAWLLKNIRGYYKTVIEEYLLTNKRDELIQLWIDANYEEYDLCPDDYADCLFEIY